MRRNPTLSSFRFFVAAEAGSLPVVQLLVERGARTDPPIPGPRCLTAMHFARRFPEKKKERKRTPGGVD